ncbi:hypothetical protein CAOG_07540 [Capsaspora owczarzaki ATCC 30864]|uniref:hypothetical protein n=1 Tax=Capsaspora owczarzaki (strain ATCC 30864) TaxID=595528 RepID=UPI0001FE5490|nr:hypothetical protein CAOG_07540 [Capsaspora owczarzaki ATCC 30864]|eukprot:XP_004343414.1 hypothetical protein CAOG_07540 [Capsaspora owczarzaki ATCC 30864]
MRVPAASLAIALLAIAIATAAISIVSAEVAANMACSSLLVTEILFRPAQVAASIKDGLRYIKLTNTGATTIDLQGLTLATASSSSHTTLSTSLLLQSGECAILASSLAANSPFNSSAPGLGIRVDWAWDPQISGLSATGDTISILSGPFTCTEISYSVTAPWPNVPPGVSILLNDTQSDPSVGWSWTTADVTDIIPGTDVADPQSASFGRPFCACSSCLASSSSSSSSSSSVSLQASSSTPSPSPASCTNLVVSEIYNNGWNQKAVYLKLSNVGSQPIDLQSLQFLFKSTQLIIGTSLVVPGYGCILLGSRVAGQPIISDSSNSGLGLSLHYTWNTAQPVLASSGGYVKIFKSGSPCAGVTYNASYPWPTPDRGRAIQLNNFGAPDAGLSWSVATNVIPVLQLHL